MHFIGIYCGGNAIACLACGRRIFTVGNYFSASDFYYPVAELCGRIAVVRDYNDERIFTYFFEQLKNIFAGLPIERTRRLVAKNKFGALNYGAGNRHTLFLPARETVGLGLGILFKLHRP